MTAEIVTAMMTPDFVLWRCLHDGPLSSDMIEDSDSAPGGTRARYRARNKALLTKLTELYGACAVMARSGEIIVGMLRFYPKAVWQKEGAGFLCLQQDFPAGPRDDFASCEFPRRGDLGDQTLKVHCLMTRSPGTEGHLFRRLGIGTKMAQRLIEWAGESGWKRIEAEAFEDLPVVYEVTGSAGRTFWEKLGFHVAGRFPHPYLREPCEFVTRLEKEAANAGIGVDKAKDSIVMRLDLA